MPQPIRLGFIGASSSKGFFGGSWAAATHMPYFNSSRNDNKYKITALQNSSTEAAERAVQAFSLDAATACYGDAQSLASDPNVDLIAVSISVPNHYDAIMPALHAGKDVFVEWPLARNIADAEAMAKMAREKEVRTLVGLQARQSPSVLAVKQLVETGTIGDILGTTMHGYGWTHADPHPAGFEYGLDIDNGANLVTISFGHAIDALCFALGELDHVSATLAIRRPEFDLADDEGQVVKRGTKTSHDYISVHGTLLKDGGVVTVVYEGGMNPTGGPGFVWQINGTKGCLLLEGSMGNVQMWQPTVKVMLKGDKEMKPVDHLAWVGDDFSYAVGKAWDEFAAHGDRVVKSGAIPTFEDALLRHRMIEAIYRSNETGTRERYL